MELELKEVANLIKGEIQGNKKTLINGFSIDTRTLKEGNCYIGIQGDNFDGNLFYGEAFSKGASAVILDKKMKSKISNNSDSIILVDDTKKALASIASSFLEKKNIPVIAVTGSVGKTSTKDMIYSIISKKYNTFKTIKNYNNDTGLPLSILSIEDQDVAVLEMGMNHLGEISNLSKIARPDIAVITNIHPVHIEHLKTMENILKAKLEIIDGLKENGVLIINNDDKYLHNANIHFSNIFTCGADNNSDLQVVKISKNELCVRYKGEITEFYHNNLTKGFINNLLLAIAAGISLKVPMESIKEGIKDLKLSEGRLENIKLKNNILLINDAYNANSESMKNAIDYLNSMEGKRKIAILGNMRELGDQSINLHSEVGEYINNENLDYLITIGSDAKYIYNSTSIENKKHFDSKESVCPFLSEFLNDNDIVLVKASNGEKFSEIIEFIKEKYKK